MKKFLMYFGVFGLLLLPAQGAFAWNIQSLNPLPYIGIGPNYSTFSLNPFTGFKNCNPCKKIEKCNKCAKIEVVPACPVCKKAFVEETCPCMRNRY